MDIAHRIAALGVPHGTAVVTEQQRAGRGHNLHKWHARRGKSLLCSIVIKPDNIRIHPTRLPSVPLRAACAVHRMLRVQLGISACIRWPNDILLADRKVCGILSEYHTADSSPGATNAGNHSVRTGEYIVIGIGLNCTQKYFMRHYNTRATSLYCYLARHANRGAFSATKAHPSGARARHALSTAPRLLLAPLIDAVIDEFADKTEHWHTYINMHLWRKGKPVLIGPSSSQNAPYPARVVDVAQDGSLRYVRLNTTPQVNSAQNFPIEYLYAGSLR